MVNSGLVSTEAPERTRPYRSPRRREQAQRTRRRILDAAREVFLAEGFGAATMRTIAVGAGVSLPTLEATFGTKARVLKAAIDVAIAGDDAPVAMLERSWTTAGLAAETADELLTIAAGVIAPAQVRSAGLLLAVFEGSRTDPALAELAVELISQRSGTAGWLVDALTAKAPLRPGLTRAEAVDTLWLLMDPAVFDRVTRHRQWTPEQYERWFARMVAAALLAHP
jgi:AcrR family transcriptional regulator